MVRAGIGVASGDVLTPGIALRSGPSFGLGTHLIGIGALVSWLPLRQKPGLGTLLNVPLIGPSAQFGLSLRPDIHGVGPQACVFAAGLRAAGARHRALHRCAIRRRTTRWTDDRPARADRRADLDREDTGGSAGADDRLVAGRQRGLWHAGVRAADRAAVQPHPAPVRTAQRRAAGRTAATPMRFASGACGPASPRRTR